MSDAIVASEYFSGQGVILLAERDVAGLPTGFTPVGNVSEVSLSIETTEFKHKESSSGARAVDLTLVQEVAGTFNMTLESLNRENLALALYGTGSGVVAGSQADLQVKLYHDKWMPLDHIKISNLVVGDDATPTTTYVLDTDYEVNLETGSVKALSTGAITDGQTCFFDYDYAAQDRVESVISSNAPERWVRFEGLNTADSNKPVTIDVYKVATKPLAELALITDEIAQMAMEAEILSDALRTSGSKYFTVKRVA